MRLVILDTYDAASEWAAKYVRNTIHKFNPGPERYFVLGLPTGTVLVVDMVACCVESLQRMSCGDVMPYWLIDSSNPELCEYLN